ncbi:hypothetical protein [Arcanobacterium buesumense]|uniref:Uncharacterized protein n=1 Tax=Arcanobacterium buesumense TaxID=2722751 RepID=A0A6H2EK90_9ACTO|nr:hypothetical protein [Arcanobacterium buesumense]QJC21776.1 hypothetical protein HC352_04160 [Arcanobacterium buesumense]
MSLTKAQAILFIQDRHRPHGRASSVRFGSAPFRIRIAKEQSLKEPTPIEDIIAYVNEFLTSLGMLASDNPQISFASELTDAEIQEVLNRTLYAPIHDAYGNCEDLVWMKFTQDGYLGVVAVSNDINFDIPPSLEAHLCTRNTPGIIVKSLHKQWDRTFVLAFPLINIPKGLKRANIETGIGNYLISQGVPILDFFSHRY